MHKVYAVVKIFDEFANEWSPETDVLCVAETFDEAEAELLRGMQFFSRVKEESPLQIVWGENQYLLINTRTHEVLMHYTIQCAKFID